MPHLRKLENEEQYKPKASEEIVRIRTGINEIKNIKAVTNFFKSWFFDNINKIDAQPI